MNLGQSIRNGVKWLAFGKVGNRLMEFAFGVALARLLVPADFGMIVTIQIFTGFVGMFTAGGMAQSLIRAKQADEQDFSAVFTLQLATGALVYLGFFVAAPWIARFFDEPLYTDLLRVSALTFLLRPLLVMRNAWLNREMNFRSRTLVDVATGFFSGLSSTLMALAGMGVWSLTLSGVLAGLFRNAWLARLTPLRARINPDVAIMRRHAGFGAKIVGNDLITYLRNEAKILIFSKLAGPTFLGLFNKAESLSRLPNQLLMSPTMDPLFRGMSKVQDDPDQVKYLYLRAITLLTAYTVPVYVMLWWIAEPFIAVVYGPKWVAAGEPMSILAIAGIFLNVVFPTGVLLAARNRLGLEMAAQGLNLLVVAAAAAIGLRWGLVGAAWGIVASQATLALHLGLMVPRVLPVRGADFVRALAPGLALGALMLAVLAAAHAALVQSGLTAHLPYLLVMGVCGALCYVLAFLLLPLKALASESARWRQKLADLFARFWRGRAAVPGAASVARVRSPALISVAVLLVGLAALGYKSRVDLGYEWSQWRSPETGHFAALPFEPRTLHHVFDVGVVDANGDGALDLFTANHNYRQSLLLGDGRGAFKDVLTEWGLDQNRDFPHWEQSFAAPILDKPGLYIYWLGETLVLRAYGAMGPVAGTLKMFSAIGIERSEGFQVQARKGKAADSPIEQTIIEFRSAGDGVLELQPPSRGVPTQIELSPDVDLARVFVGRQRASPTSRSFSPFLRDRHGHAWTDLDGDGRLDAYITRGGVGGTIRMLPGFIRESIRDELMLSAGGPPYRDAALPSGIQKKDCSGRHADWVDIDGDGRLELFVNCQDRGRADGGFPKQLWRADAGGRYQDVATAVGLGLLGREIIDYVWTDIDGDGDIDLVTVEDKGFFVHLNQDGRFTAQLLHRPDFVRDDVSGLKAEVNNYWRFDSKLVAADFDNDGDMDLFSASKRGNLLLENQGGGRFRVVTPGKLGLPDSSLLGVWVDYDNDGLTDLHLIPQGLYRQTDKGHFVATGLLAVRPHLYQAAIAHWFDIDNDGRRDAWLALNENPGLWRWWQRPFRDENDAHAWSVQAWRNLERDQHWLQIDVGGGAGNREAINARVTVYTPQGAQVQDVGINDSSYFSQGHYRLYFGLGTRKQADRVVVRWTDGRTLELRNVTADQRLRIDHPDTPQ